MSTETLTQVRLAAYGGFELLTWLETSHAKKGLIITLRDNGDLWTVKEVYATTTTDLASEIHKTSKTVGRSIK